MASGQEGTLGGLVTSPVVMSPTDRAGTQCCNQPATRLGGQRPGQASASLPMLKKERNRQPLERQAVPGRGWSRTGLAKPT